MKKQEAKETETQRKYYAETAMRYDEMHLDDDEHTFALSFMLSMLDRLKVRSVLDIGSGTGRAPLFIKQRRPDIRIVGIEPVEELRKLGYQNGLTESELIAGDATRLDFANEEFDLVCEFGMLHHIKHPEKAVAEMLRVAKTAIFISDSNNFGQGSIFSRLSKQTINFFCLWKLVDYIKTRGKGYTISKDDGLGYSYSVFNNYNQIKKVCKCIHILNTKDGGINPYRTASHVSLLGMKSLTCASKIR